MNISRSQTKHKSGFFKNLLFRKQQKTTAIKRNDVYLLPEEIKHFKDTITIYKVDNTESDMELISIYFDTEPDDISSKYFQHFTRLGENNKRRLNVDVVVFGELSHFEITDNNSPIFKACNKWTKYIVDAIENLEETLTGYKQASVDEVCLYHLARSIAHLTNCIHTLSDMSNQNPDSLEDTAYYYISEIVNGINGFRTDFCKFCTEINTFISEFKQTLKLLIDRDPQNAEIIYNMNDVEKLYSIAKARTEDIKTDTPNDINTSIRFIDVVSNDINDTKRDVVEIKLHQFKDEKYLRSTYV
jgi:hypothetical protein